MEDVIDDNFSRTSLGTNCDFEYRGSDIFTNTFQNIGYFGPSLRGSTLGRLIEKFQPKFDKCKLRGVEGVAFNVHYCYDTNVRARAHRGVILTRDDVQGVQAPCANNCRGVDPNSIIGGGAAVLATSGFAAQFLAPAGLGVAGIAGENVCCW